MKKLFFIASIALSITACGPMSETSNPPTGDTIPQDTNKVEDPATIDSTSTDPSLNPDSIQKSMKMSLQMEDTTNKL